MKAKSFQADTLAELTGALDDAMADGFAPTQAFVFLSTFAKWPGLQELFADHDIQVFGGSAYGEFIEGDFKEDAVAVLLTDMDPDAFRILHSELRPGGEKETATKMAEQVAGWMENPAFLIMTSHTETVAEDLIAGIESVTGPDVDMFGAMVAESDFAMQNLTVFSADWHSLRGVILMAIDKSRVDVHGVATCGWKPAGSVKTITKSDGMWVHEIDGEPALDVVLKFSGIATKEELTPELWIQNALLLPPQLFRDEGATVMRPTMTYDLDTDSIMCVGRMPQGSNFRFSIAPEEDVIDSVIDGCRKLKEVSAPDADAIVYFSCAGRRIILGPLLKREINSVRALWDAPMAGCFSMSEIARATGGQNELCGVTSVCVVLKEK